MILKNTFFINKPKENYQFFSNFKGWVSLAMVEKFVIKITEAMESMAIV